MTFWKNLEAWTISLCFSEYSLVFVMCALQCVWNADIRNFISCWMFAPKLVTILLLNCCKSTLFCRVSCAVCSVEPSRASFPGHIEANLGGGEEKEAPSRSGRYSQERVSRYLQQQWLYRVNSSKLISLFYIYIFLCRNASIIQNL